MAKCLRSKNKNLFDLSDLISKLLVSEMGEFFLPRSAFINFVGNIINLTLLKVTGIEKNRIKLKRLEKWAEVLI